MGIFFNLPLTDRIPSLILAPHVPHPKSRKLEQAVQFEKRVNRTRTPESHAGSWNAIFVQVVPYPVERCAGRGHLEDVTRPLVHRLTADYLFVQHPHGLEPGLAVAFGAHLNALSPIAKNRLATVLVTPAGLWIAAVDVLSHPLSRVKAHLK
ncbi:MAG: hypothetical protein M1133_02375 [Armatimonadetes bacterium]|nr:hypothetical protein [Armatimonadota bacterium]